MDTRELYLEISKESEAQKRIRSAIAGFPFSGGTVKLHHVMDYDTVAENLEILSKIIKADCEKNNLNHQELQKLQAQRSAVREFFGIQNG